MPVKDNSSIVTEFLTGLAEAPARLERLKIYTPYIAGTIFDALKDHDPNGIIASADQVKDDLHETGGYFLSSDKFVEVEDRNGNRYRVTVEDIRADNAKPLTSRERDIIRAALAPTNPALAERFRERR